MIKKISILFFSIFFLTIILMLSWKEQKEEVRCHHILYSWNLEEIEKDSNRFVQVLKDYQIDTIYQDFTSEDLKTYQNDWIKQMKDKNIVVYHLAGDASWGREGGFFQIVEEIQKVEKYNEQVIVPIKGIVLDIEPYVSEKEEKFAKEDFEIYVGEIKKTYRYLQNRNLELRLAIPYWFNQIDENLLAELIQNTDGISVMNYNINKTKENIKEEWLIAQTYQKQIDTIYEIEYGKENYFTSKEAIWNDFQAIQEEYQTYPIDIAYHHYKTMK